MTQPSPLYRLIEAGLDGTLAEFVAARRPDKSWREIAEDIEAKTGTEIHGETLRLWFAGRVTVEVTIS